MRGRNETKLIHDHLALVRRLALSVQRLVGTQVDLDDLIAEGRLGLVTAARRYDRRRGVAFDQFASSHIRGAILDGVRRHAPLTRRQWQALRHQVDPRPVPLREDLLPASDDPERDAIQAQTYRRVLRGLARLRGRERRFVELYYGQGETLARTGAALGVSKSWACRLKARAVARVAGAVSCTIVD